MSVSRRLALLDWAERSGAFVVEDDYDSEYRYVGRPIESLQGLDRSGRVLYVGTFSKVLFPALRLGYLVLPRPLVDVFRTAKALADTGCATLEQSALADFMREGHYERYLRRSRAHAGARREALLEAISTYLGERVEVCGADAGLHVVLWLRGVHRDHLPSLVERAAAAGVGVYPATPYYLHPPKRAGLLLGYASLSETEIHRGIERLGQFLE
jgi:GntR family transcriptional regulator/MocR family aminotransferase